jgi:hypothetical protein
MFQCSLCKQPFADTHHPDKCRDNLINEIVDELDDIRCLSIIKKILDYIKQFTDEINKLEDFIDY